MSVSCHLDAAAVRGQPPAQVRGAQRAQRPPHGLLPVGPGRLEHVEQQLQVEKPPVVGLGRGRRGRAERGQCLRQGVHRRRLRSAVVAGLSTVAAAGALARRGEADVALWVRRIALPFEVPRQGLGGVAAQRSESTRSVGLSGEGGAGWVQDRTCMRSHCCGTVAAAAARVASSVAVATSNLLVLGIHTSFVARGRSSSPSRGVGKNLA